MISFILNSTYNSKVCFLINTQIKHSSFNYMCQRFFNEFKSKFNLHFPKTLAQTSIKLSSSCEYLSVITVLEKSNCIGTILQGKVTVKNLQIILKLFPRYLLIMLKYSKTYLHCCR